MELRSVYKSITYLRNVDQHYSRNSDDTEYHPQIRRKLVHNLIRDFSLKAGVVRHLAPGWGPSGRKGEGMDYKGRGGDGAGRQ